MPTKGLTARGQRTRQSLLTAGRKVFERDGFLAARITDISAEARVAHGTFYTHFATKEDLFREVASILLPEIAPGPAEIEYRGRIETIRGIICANRRYLEAYRQDAKLMSAVEQVATFDDGVRDILACRSRAYLARTEAQILCLQRAGLLSPDADAYCMANALGSMVSRFAHVVYAGSAAVDRPIDFDVSVRTLTLIWANAIGLGIGADEVERIYAQL
jgi:AcrR family transcriptional regulator